MNNNTTSQTSLSSEKEIPKIKLGLQDKYEQEDKKEELVSRETKKIDETNVESIADELPEPSGYRILVLPFTPKDKTKGGIIIAQESLDRLRIATNCGYVLKIGPIAYKDEKNSHLVRGAKKEIG
jgi:hypothetical protein